MSTPDEVLGLLAGSDAEVIERLGGVRDRPTLLVVHLAERYGRLRQPVLRAIERRGNELGGAVDEVFSVPALERDVAEVLATIAFSRPSVPALPHDDLELVRDDVYPIPMPEEFIDARTGHIHDFAEAPDLEQVARHVIGEHADYLPYVETFRIKYLWRAKGTATNGIAKLAYAHKLTGLERYGMAGTEFVIVAAADLLRQYEMTVEQMCALMFHEHKHLILTERATPGLVGHDLELFVDEVKLYGPWREGLKQIAALQMPMPLMTGGRIGP